jgi:hypothetical protein
MRCWWAEAGFRAWWVTGCASTTCSPAGAAPVSERVMCCSIAWCWHQARLRPAWVGWTWWCFPVATPRALP